MHENLAYSAITGFVVLLAVVSICGGLIFVERKIAAWVQDRVGPNRVGPAGLLQPLADVLKFIFKEEIIPDHVDKFLFMLAPAIGLSAALLAFVVVPFGDTTGENYRFVIAPGIDIGILFVFAVASLTVYSLILSGWSANNKYSFIGGLRSSAQLVSYEIPMGLSILGVILMSGSLNLERIIAQQAGSGGVWNIFFQPLAFLIFLVSGFAECNRLPFDLPEAEQELIGGYHTEYSAMKFAMFFLGEYTHMVTTSFLNVTLFFGGWQFPWIAETNSHWLIKLVVFGAKVTCFIVFFMLVRWTLPRFRFDQLMALAWKVLIPLAVINLVCVMIVKQLGWNPWWLLPASVLIVIVTGWIAALPTTRRAVT